MDLDIVWTWTLFGRVNYIFGWVDHVAWTGLVVKCIGNKIGLGGVQSLCTSNWVLVELG